MRVACHHHQKFDWSVGYHVVLRLPSARFAMPIDLKNAVEPMPLARANSSTPSRLARTMRKRAAPQPTMIADRYSRHAADNVGGVAIDVGAGLRPARGAAAADGSSGS